MAATPLTASQSADAPSSGILQLHVLDGGGWAQVPLRYVRRDGRLYLLAPADLRPRWVDQLLSSSVPARWRVLGQEFIGKASLRSDRAEVAAVCEGFTSRFGAAKMAEWFGGSVSCLSLQPTGEVPDDYARLVRLSFDALADDYDSVVEDNRFDLRLRDTTRNTRPRSERCPCPRHRHLIENAEPPLRKGGYARTGIVRPNAECQGSGHRNPSGRIRTGFLRRRVLRLRRTQLRAGLAERPGSPRIPSPPRRGVDHDGLEPTVSCGDPCVSGGSEAKPGVRAVAGSRPGRAIEVRDSGVRPLRRRDRPVVQV